MSEAEKTGILPAVETPAASPDESRRVSRPETEIPKEIFDQLQSLIGHNQGRFDLVGKIKRLRSVDKQAKEEMLNLADEARSKIVAYQTEGFSPELAAEAAAYFDLLLEMGEKHIPKFDKKLAEYNEKQIRLAEELAAREKESLPTEPAEEKASENNSLGQPEQNEAPQEASHNNEVKEEDPLTNNKKNMGTEKEKPFAIEESDEEQDEKGLAGNLEILRRVKKMKGEQMPEFLQKKQEELEQKYPDAEKSEGFREAAAGLDLLKNVERAKKGEPVEPIDLEGLGEESKKDFEKAQEGLSALAAKKRAEKSGQENKKTAKDEAKTSSAGRTLQGGLAALVDSGKLEKVTVPENQPADAIESEPDQTAAEAATNNPAREEAPKNSGKNLEQEKSSASKEPLGGESAAKVAEIEKKMADAYREFFNKKIESEGRREITDALGKELFNIYKKEFPKETKKDLWAKVDEFRNTVHNETLGQVREARAQEKSRAESKKAKAEERKKKSEEETTKPENRQNRKEGLTQRLDETMKDIYGYISDKKDVPEELKSQREEILTELWGVTKDRNKVGEIAEKIKNKYRKTAERGKKITEEKKTLKISAEEIARRAEEIKQRRLRGEKGFEGEKIDAMLRRRNIEPMTPAAGEYMDRWDSRRAKEELLKETKKAQRPEADKKIPGKVKEPVPPRDIVDEALPPRDISLEEIDAEDREEMEEYEKERELARLGAEITLAKINNYEELWALTKQEGDVKFKEKTRELWKEFAVHGKVLKDKESGEVKVMKFTDLDGNASLGLLKLAGIDTTNLEHKEPGKYDAGKINIDTGERHGIVVEDDGKTVFIDHHSDESGKDSSATKFTYELLVSLGLLEKQEYLDKLVEFVTQEDNKTYPNEEKYFKNYGHNLFGLRDNIKFEHLLTFFKDGHKPYEVLQEKELKKMGLLKISEEKNKLVEKSLAELERIKDKGLILETSRYGKIVVDINKKIPFGFDAIRHAGYQTYVSWAPADESFFISSVHPIMDNFRQGKKIRETMWIKPLADRTPLSVSLRDTLGRMIDGRAIAHGELAEFLAEEEKKEKEKKAELAPEVWGFLRSERDNFYNKLRVAAEQMESWPKYSEKNKETLLEIEVETFLRELIEQELVGRGMTTRENVGNVVRKLIAEGVKKIEGPVEKEGRELSERKVTLSERQDILEEYKKDFAKKTTNELTLLSNLAHDKLRRLPEYKELLSGFDRKDLLISSGAADLLAQFYAADQIMEERREDGQKEEKKEPVAPAVPEKEKAERRESVKSSENIEVEGYLEIFKNKNDEELAILKKQIEDRMQGIPVKEFPYFWAEPEDLLKQWTAVDKIQRQKQREKLGQ